MNAISRQPGDRLAELLAGEAAGELTAAERQELDALLAAEAGLPRDELMSVAGLLQVSFLHRDRAALEPMPAALRQKVEQQAMALFASRQAGNDARAADGVVPMRRPNPPPSPARTAWWRPAALAGWALAAALVLALVIPRGESPRPAAQRAELLAAAGTTISPWQPPEAPGFEQVTGDVVWNGARQQGYLRLAGMPANDPARRQYQLWIVDPDRDRNPVDGGVFDIPAGPGEVIIPIQAKLPVNRPRAFAITAEQPGGVVVSGGPLLVVAPVTG